MIITRSLSVMAYSGFGSSLLLFRVSWYGSNFVWTALVLCKPFACLISLFLNRRDYILFGHESWSWYGGRSLNIHLAWNILEQILSKNRSFWVWCHVVWWDRAVGEDDVGTTEVGVWTCTWVGLDCNKGSTELGVSVSGANSVWLVFVIGGEGVGTTGGVWTFATRSSCPSDSVSQPIACNSMLLMITYILRLENATIICRAWQGQEISTPNI